MLISKILLKGRSRCISSTTCDCWLSATCSGFYQAWWAVSSTPVSAGKSGIYFSWFKEFVNKNFIWTVITLQPLARLKGVFSWMAGVRKVSDTGQVSHHSARSLPGSNRISPGHSLTDSIARSMTPTESVQTLIRTDKLHKDVCWILFHRHLHLAQKPGT